MPRIAWFSPVAKNQPLKSVVYTREILETAPESWEIELFVDDEDFRELQEDLGEIQLEDAQPEELTLLGRRVFHYLRADERAKAEAFDLFVYQLEDSPRCRFVQNFIPVWPGVTILHDLNLRQLELSKLTHGTTEVQLNEHMEEVFGTGAARVGDYQVRGWSIEAFDRLYPEGEESVRNSGLVVVGALAIKSRLEKLFPHMPIVNLPFPIETQSPGSVRQVRHRFRRTLSIPQNEIVIGFTGERPLINRTYAVLEAFSALYQGYIQRPVVSTAGVRLLWIVSDSRAEEEALDLITRHVADEAVANSITVAQASGIDTLVSLLSTVDIYCGVYFDENRGLPLSLLMALARGIPSVVSDIGASRELPTGAVLKCPVGKGEAQMLKLALEELMRNSSLAKELHNNAIGFIQLVMDPKAIVADLNLLFAEHSLAIKQQLDAAEGKYADAQEGILLSMLNEASFSEMGNNEESPLLIEFAKMVKGSANDFSWLK